MRPYAQISGIEGIDELTVAIDKIEYLLLEDDRVICQRTGESEENWQFSSKKKAVKVYRAIQRALLSEGDSDDQI